MEPREQILWDLRQLAARKNDAKNVTVNNRANKWGKYGLHKNDGLLFCKPFGKKAYHLHEDVR